MAGAILASASALLLAQDGRAPGDGANGLSRADAVRMREKVAAIEQFANAAPKSPRGAPAPAGRTLTTPVTEREVNAYLAFDAGADIPVGIAKPRIAILDSQRLSGTALVDLDAVRAHHNSTSWFDPMNYLSGQLPVSVTGRLSSADGLARFQLERATVSGIPIPKTLLQELLTYYSRTPTNPGGLNLDDAFELPARIRRIDVRRGEAVVVQ